MNRPLALACALLCASVAVSSACLAQVGDLVRFTLAPGNGTIVKDPRRTFSKTGTTKVTQQMVDGLHAVGTHGVGGVLLSWRRRTPLHFAIVREAGRLDCRGSGGGGRARGNCRFTRRSAFTQLLAAMGSARQATARPSG